MIVFGITGKKGSGKDTAAWWLINECGFVRIAFADPVKRVAKQLFPHLTDEQCWGSIESKETIDPITGVTPRWIFQKVGTEIGREGQLDYFDGLGVRGYTVAAALNQFQVRPGLTAWIDAAFTGLDPDGRYVLSDVRFPNEAEAVRTHGGTVWRIHRPGASTGKEENHASETEIDNIYADHDIYNDGTITDLYLSLIHLYPFLSRQ